MKNLGNTVGLKRNSTASVLNDLSLLIKFRLTSVVVLSSGIAYLIGAAETFELMVFTQLMVGGFLITAASNILNEVLEKDFDALMKRTANRPVAAGRMSVSSAVLVAGISASLGLILLAMIHPLAVLLGSLALVSYSFIYTPLKRFSLWAVPVGAIPGAIPVLIGAVVGQGGITMLAIVLFAIQFLWQFPHFWAIAWLGFDDYKKAGYQFVPEKNGEVDPKIAIHSMVYALLLVPVVLWPSIEGVNHIATGLVLALLSVLFAYLGIRLYKGRSRKDALILMFGSLLYLPIVLGLIWLG